MMNFIFAFLFIFGIICGLFSGRSEMVSAAIFSGASDAVNLILTLAGTMCFWGGIMKIAEKSGAVDLMGKLLYPLTRVLFPKLKKNSDAMRAIILNMSANILGLSNAATPMGIKAMEALKKENNLNDTASDDMCMLVVINTASLQLIPSTLIALRISNHSNAPFEIVPSVWVVSVCAIICGVCAAWILRKVYKTEGKR